MAIITIKKNQAIRRIFAEGEFSADRLLVLYRRFNGSGVRRFGFTVSGKVGGAVVRNRVRRRLKEICRRHTDCFEAGYDYVVLARAGAAQVDYRAIKDSLLRLAGSNKWRGPGSV